MVFKRSYYSRGRSLISTKRIAEEHDKSKCEYGTSQQTIYCSEYKTDKCKLSCNYALGKLEKELVNE